MLRLPPVFNFVISNHWQAEHWQVDKIATDANFNPRDQQNIKAAAIGPSDDLELLEPAGRQQMEREVTSCGWRSSCSRLQYVFRLKRQRQGQLKQKQGANTAVLLA